MEASASEVLPTTWGMVAWILLTYNDSLSYVSALGGFLHLCFILKIKIVFKKEREINAHVAWQKEIGFSSKIPPSLLNTISGIIAKTTLYF